MYLKKNEFMFSISLKSNYFYSSFRAWKFDVGLETLGRFSQGQIKGECWAKYGHTCNMHIYNTKLYVHLYVRLFCLPSPNGAHWHRDVHLYIRIL